MCRCNTKIHLTSDAHAYGMQEHDQTWQQCINLMLHTHATCRALQSCAYIQQSRQLRASCSGHLTYVMYWDAHAVAPGNNWPDKPHRLPGSSMCVHMSCAYAYACRQNTRYTPSFIAFTLNCCLAPGELPGTEPPAAPPGSCTASVAA